MSDSKPDPLTGITVDRHLLRSTTNPLVQLAFEAAEALMAKGEFNPAIMELSRVMNEANDQERIMLYALQGACVIARGTPAEAVKVFHESAEHASLVNWSPGLAAQVANRGVAELAVGDVETAEQTFNAVVKMTRELNFAPEAQANALFGLARIHKLRGNERSMRECAQQAVEIAAGLPEQAVALRMFSSGLVDFDQLNSDRLRASARELRKCGGAGPAEMIELKAEGQSAYARGEMARARDLYEQALERALALGDHFTAGQLHSGVGQTRVKENDKAGSVADYRHAREHYVLAGDRRQVATTDALLGMVLFETGEPQLAIGHLLDGYRFCPEYGDEMQAKAAGNRLAVLLLMVGRDQFVRGCEEHGLSTADAERLAVNLKRAYPQVFKQP